MSLFTIQEYEEMLVRHRREGNWILEAGDLRGIGLCYMESGKAQKALEYFKESLRIVETDTAYKHMAYTYEYLLGDLQTAEKYWKQALAISPDDYMRGFYQRSIEIVRKKIAETE